MQPRVSNEAVVDTNVVSYVFRQDTRAAAYRSVLNEHQLVPSFMTVAELEQWAIARSWGIRRLTELMAYIDRFGIVASSRALARTWAEVTTLAQRRGRPIGVADAWIAATALLYNLPLITQNASD